MRGTGIAVRTAREEAGRAAGRWPPATAMRLGARPIGGARASTLQHPSLGDTTTATVSAAHERYVYNYQTTQCPFMYCARGYQSGTGAAPGEGRRRVRSVRKARATVRSNTRRHAPKAPCRAFDFTGRDKILFYD